MLYDPELPLVWVYETQLLVCVRDSNIEVTQSFRNKVLKVSVNKPFYVRNRELHRDLVMESVTDNIKFP